MNLRTDSNYRTNSAYRGARHWRSGFTLIEMLVVFGVIAVLAALVVPAVQRSLQSSKTAKCVGNLKGIGAGLFAYIADNNGELPPCASLPNSGYKVSYRKKTYWFDALNPYMGHSEYAPDRSTPFPEPDSVGTEFPFAWQQCPAKNVKPLQRQNVGYGWNLSNFGSDLSSELASPGGTGFGSRMSQVNQPSRTIIIGDSKDAGVRTENVHEDRYIFDYGAEKRVPYPERHAGGGNYLFLDGHVDLIKAVDMKTPEVRALFKRSK